jgi:hypothetical protein
MLYLLFGFFLLQIAITGNKLFALDVGVYGVVNFKIFKGRDQTIRQEMENLRQPADGFCGICVHSSSPYPV